MTVDRGTRVRNARKRAGLTQRELVDRCPALSLIQLRRIENGECDVRLSMLRPIAVALGVRTSDLQDKPDSEYADADTEAAWTPVRQALVGKVPASDEPVTVAAVQSTFDSIRPLIGTNQYTKIAALLPALLADLSAIDDTEQHARSLRSRILNMTGWLLTQCRQFDVAETTLMRAIDAAEDRVEAACAVNTWTWTLLRQGRLNESRDLAIRWADDIEPKFSKATTLQLATWGRLWLTVANAAVRDNQPGETADALGLARAAAHRIGQEIYADTSTVRTFGPTTVDHIIAESHALAGQPDLALAVAARTTPSTVQPFGANRMRHRLDIGSAHAQLGQYTEAIGEMQRAWAVAPQWLVQQRYARDILAQIIGKRRTLTPEMRELADHIQLEY